MSGYTFDKDGGVTPKRAPEIPVRKKHMYPEDRAMAAFFTGMIMLGLFFWGWALITAPVIISIATVTLWVGARMIYPLACRLVEKLDE